MTWRDGATGLGGGAIDSLAGGPYAIGYSSGGAGGHGYGSIAGCGGIFGARAAISGGSVDGTTSGFRTSDRFGGHAHGGSAGSDADGLLGGRPLYHTQGRGMSDH